jgi:hypothetical protein
VCVFVSVCERERERESSLPQGELARDEESDDQAEPFGPFETSRAGLWAGEISRDRELEREQERGEDDPLVVAAGRRERRDREIHQACGERAKEREHGNCG